MKPSTQDVIIKLMRDMTSGEDIAEIFEIYSTREIFDLQSLLGQSHRKFYELVRSQMPDIPELEQKTAQGMAHKRVYALESLKDKSRRETLATFQKEFAGEVKSIVMGDKKVKVLDIGSGRIPYSSILLGAEGYDVTSMDNFYLSNECLSNLGVKSWRGMFYFRQDVSNYDLLVGRKPCSAIRSMVIAGKKYDKPYFIRLCDCSLGGGEIYEWRHILTRIDRGIQFFGDYAYNLSNARFETPNNIEDIISMDTE